MANVSLCPVDNKYVYLTGGKYNEPKDPVLAQCARFNIDTEEWQVLADMNVARFNHSSCQLGQKVYVFCGVGKRGILNSIE